ISRTIIVTFNAPDLGGFPPSTAVTISVCLSLCSRSSNFLSTRNGIFPASLCRTLISKCSFAVTV
uniref:Uncharacterized protein n=1 Tax=Takifugu rubripes TaxID=31033 RepID=A0A3B5K227_TAKRU